MAEVIIMKIARLLLCLIMVCGCDARAIPPPIPDPVPQPENWPALIYNADWVAKAKDYVATYQQRWDFSQNIAPYDSFGPYLNYHLTKDYSARPKVRFVGGLPEVRYGDAYYRNPVTMSQFALMQHGAGEHEQFLATADALLEMQDLDGAFRYQFPWTYYLSGETYAPGWVSGMAQGQALSVFARAYHLTGDKRYLTAGNLAFDFMLIPTTDGGVMTTLADLDQSLSGYIWFEEYVSSPANYTLNGYMFALLGLYDWSHYNPVAGDYFGKGIESLVNMLPYYDIGGMTCYDLGHITFGDKDPHVNTKYHGVHIKLLHALHSITGNRWLQHFEHLWQSYIE